MEEDAVYSLYRQKENTNTTDEKNDAAKTSSVILSCPGDVPLATVTKYVDDPRKCGMHLLKDMLVSPLSKTPVYRTH